MASPQTSEGSALPTQKPRTRQLDASEFWMQGHVDKGTTSADREQYGLTGGMELRFPASVGDPVPYLRRAWLATCRFNPRQIMADEAPEGDNADAVISKWSDHSFFVHRTTGSGLTAIKEVPSAASTTLYWLPNSSELFIKISHRRVDGHACMVMMTAYLATVTGLIRFGLDIDIESKMARFLKKSTVPGTQESKKVEVEVDEEQEPEHIKKAADALMAEYSGCTPSISLPIRKGTESDAPTETGHASVTLDEATSRAVRKACTDRGISVAMALNASMIRAVASTQQDPRAKHYASHINMNYRKLLQNDSSSQDLEVGIHVWAHPFGVPNARDATFDQILERVSDAYKTDLSELSGDKKKSPESFSKLMLAYMKREQEFEHNYPADFPPLRSPNFSSLGVVDRILPREFKINGKGDKIEVESACFLVEVLDQMPLFIPHAFKNRFSIQACFNNTWYDVDFFNQVLEKMKDELLEGLKINQARSQL